MNFGKSVRTIEWMEVRILSVDREESPIEAIQGIPELSGGSGLVRTYKEDNRRASHRQREKKYRLGSASIADRPTIFQESTELRLLWTF